MTGPARKNTRKAKDGTEETAFFHTLRLTGVPMLYIMLQNRMFCCRALEIISRIIPAYGTKKDKKT
jgi:hypothetical protein